MVSMVVKTFLGNKRLISPAMQTLEFTKYHGLGNDFILIDARNFPISTIKEITHPNFIKKRCSRHTGIGADGIILALNPTDNSIIKMRIFNSDGSEPEMCGNGIRCLAKFLIDINISNTSDKLIIETNAGKIIAEIEQDGEITVDMGKPILESFDIPTNFEVGICGLPQGKVEIDGENYNVAAVGMGNPHLILPIQNLDSFDLELWGKQLEYDSHFPSLTNVHFLRVDNPNSLTLKVWERGAGATLACGTGACASLVAANLLGLCENKAEVKLPGGVLFISWPDKMGSVYMKGSAQKVYKGSIDI